MATVDEAGIPRLKSWEVQREVKYEVAYVKTVDGCSYIVDELDGDEPVGRGISVAGTAQLVQQGHVGRARLHGPGGMHIRRLESPRGPGRKLPALIHRRDTDAYANGSDTASGRDHTDDPVPPHDPDPCWSGGPVETAGGSREAL